MFDEPEFDKQIPGSGIHVFVLQKLHIDCNSISHTLCIQRTNKIAFIVVVGPVQTGCTLHLKVYKLFFCHFLASLSCLILLIQLVYEYHNLVASLSRAPTNPLLKRSSAKYFPRLSSHLFPSNSGRPWLQLS